MQGRCRLRSRRGVIKKQRGRRDAAGNSSGAHRWKQETKDVSHHDGDASFDLWQTTRLGHVLFTWQSHSSSLHSYLAMTRTRRFVELTWSTLCYLSSNLNFLNCTITVPTRACPQTSVLWQAPTANPQHVHLDDRHLPVLHPGISTTCPTTRTTTTTGLEMWCEFKAISFSFYEILLMIIIQIFYEWSTTTKHQWQAMSQWKGLETHCVSSPVRFGFQVY